MQVAHLRSLLAVLALSFVAACGSSSTAGPDGGGAADGGGSVGTGNGCWDYFDFVFGGGCNGPVLPDAELARQRARFLSECQALLALPGQGLTANALETCAQGVHASDQCRFTDLAAGSCPSNYMTGSLPAGASCVDSHQCQSGTCQFAPATRTDAGTVAAACGMCTSFVPLGQPCTLSGGMACASDAACTGSPPVCTPIQFGSPAGTTCTGANACQIGLYCAPGTGKCTVPGGAGASCADTGQCGPRLYCISGTCQPPREVGTSCPGNIACDYPLTCSSSTMQCTPTTWASSGQPCNETTRCLVGNCSAGVCQTVIPDGQPCATSQASTCDAFAQCTAGICQTSAAAVCP